MTSSETGLTARFVCTALLALAVVPIALAATELAPHNHAGPELMPLVLRGPQVGPGYVLKTRPDGFGAEGFVTLDLCGFNFRSEKLRTNRLQVNYVRAATPVQLSNEVVSYKPGGAEQAMREVNSAVGSCPKGPVASSVEGVGLVTYRFTRLRATGLLPGYIALREQVTGTFQGKAFKSTAIVVYQRRGSVLSGIYSYGGTLTNRTEMTFHAARQSAKNLSG